MRIGLDLDGVCYPFVSALRQFLVDFRGYEPEALPDATRWEFFRDWGMTSDEFRGACVEGAEVGYLFWFGRPFHGVTDAVTRLSAAGHEIHIVTARQFGASTAPQRATVSWLDAVDLEFDSLTFSSDKTAVPTDVFLDDHADNYLALRAAGVGAYLMSQPWNAHLDTPHRVSSVAEFADRILNGSLDLRSEA